jgi:UDP-N-acetylglucosamine--N-acetylmuramyl-(pentapeptide) pyrophosphoryl-undecaprenol N-acetylglucosamine transferase
MPSRHKKAQTAAISPESARAFLGLAPSCFTLLVFGGSQGAQGINRHIPSLLHQLRAKKTSLQLIHITGNENSVSEIQALCQHLQISCHVKSFEMQMQYPWRASTLAIGRSGASTLSEMIQFEVPGIVIPYPHSSDAHQVVNAEFFVKDVQGGIYLLEEKVTPEALCDAILDCEKKLEYYKSCMRTFKQMQQKLTLSQLIYEHFTLY